MSTRRSRSPARRGRRARARRGVRGGGHEKLAEARRWRTRRRVRAGRAEQARREAQQLADEPSNRPATPTRASRRPSGSRAHEGVRQADARRLQAQPGNETSLVHKPELVELAAGIGIRGRTNMTKASSSTRSRRRLARSAERRRPMRLFTERASGAVPRVDRDSLDVPRKLPAIVRAALKAACSRRGLRASRRGARISSLREGRGRFVKLSGSPSLLPDTSRSQAGHERYAQIVGAVEKASRRLEEFSSARPATGRSTGRIASAASRDPIRRRRARSWWRRPSWRGCWASAPDAPRDRRADSSRRQAAAAVRASLLREAAICARGGGRRWPTRPEHRRGLRSSTSTRVSQPP